MTEICTGEPVVTVLCALSVSFRISVSNILLGLTVHLLFHWLPILVSL